MDKVGVGINRVHWRQAVRVHAMAITKANGVSWTELHPRLRAAAEEVADEQLRAMGLTPEIVESGWAVTAIERLSWDCEYSGFMKDWEIKTDRGEIVTAESLSEAVDAALTREDLDG